MRKGLAEAVFITVRWLARRDSVWFWTEVVP